MTQTAHLNDHDLLLFAEGELSASHASRTRLHIDTCELCRKRLTEIESTAVSAASAIENPESLEAAPVSVSRAALRTRIAELAAAEESQSTKWLGLRWPSALQTAALVCGLFLITAATAKFMQPAPQSSYSADAAARFIPASERADIPNRSLTPGVARTVSLAEVCAMRHEEVELDVPDPVRAAVFQEYGIANARPNDYEIDYLIAPGLGGTQDMHNLWPEPESKDSWNAHVKDSLEEYLHESVCSGRIDLRTAQSDISSDWISAYKKYFHTKRPLAATASRTGFAPKNIEISQPIALNLARL